MRHHSQGRSDVNSPRSKFYHGPFGRIFSELPPWSPPGVADGDIEAHFRTIAENDMTEAPGLSPGDIAGDIGKINELEQQFGSNLPAGYTYFGQFVDHDITFDPTSSLMRRNDPDKLQNFRTPRLDLDNIYGRGPSDSPYLYDQTDTHQGRVDKLLIGTVAGTNLRDLPRNSQGRALIGDMRNDENSIVAQLQLAFLLAHNELADRARAAGVEDTFGAARTTLRWLYQRIVWHDFLSRVTSPAVHSCALKVEPTCDDRSKCHLGLADIYRWKHQPFMPVEFSVAAYRFGHSLVRNSYQTNLPHRGFQQFAPIFDNTSAGDPDDLRGFRPLKQENYVQWDWFLHMVSSAGPFPQRARKIDTKLSNALAALHEDTPGSILNVLAARNLIRGHRFALPSGTSVAKKLCVEPINIAPDRDALWFYILKEAETLRGVDAGQRLGTVGSLIVCATFAGLLKGDPCSYLNVDPNWCPGNDVLLQPADNQDPGDWTLSSIIRIAGLPVDGDDVTNQT